MARGQRANDGDTRISANGYHYTRENGKWRLTHHLTAEKMLGRPLKEDERVHFKPGFSKKSYADPNAINVVVQGKSSGRRRLAALDARIDELIAERDALEAELGEAHVNPNQPIKAELSR